MPDWWEEKNGTNPALNDAMTLKDGYANIEHYINSIDQKSSQPFAKAPVALSAESTSNQVTLSWKNFNNYDTKFVVEQLINGSFKKVKKTKANVTQCTIGNLTPNTSYTFRVRAISRVGYFRKSYYKIVEVRTKQD